jgi:hypothetical protein
MLPPSPLAYLIGSQTRLTRGVLESAFDPETSPLQSCQFLLGSGGVGICQGILDRAWTGLFTAGNQKDEVWPASPGSPTPRPPPRPSPR